MWPFNLSWCNPPCPSQNYGYDAEEFTAHKLNLFLAKQQLYEESKEQEKLLYAVLWVVAELQQSD